MSATAVKMAVWWGMGLIVDCLFRRVGMGCPATEHSLTWHVCGSVFGHMDRSTSLWCPIFSSFFPYTGTNVTQGTLHISSICATSKQLALHKDAPRTRWKHNKNKVYHSQRFPNSMVTFQTD